VGKCQKSPIWMMLILWGFFGYCGIWYLLERKEKREEPGFWLLGGFLLVSLGLIVFPEFFYFKDIYPLHFRSNTMFKLGYQAFIMSGIASGYAIVHELRRRKKFSWLMGALVLLILVGIYPKFSVRSYFGDLKTYQGIFGLDWLATRYPDDARAIDWLLQENPPGSQPIIVEASGDSYTDYNRISAFTGLPTVAGWMVHEWLWRGSYEPIANRAEEVRYVYESPDEEGTKLLLENYGVKYIIVGTMEKQKYPNLNENKLTKLGKKVFSSGTTTIYQVI